MVFSTLLAITVFAWSGCTALREYWPIVHSEGFNYETAELQCQNTFKTSLATILTAQDAVEALEARSLSGTLQHTVDGLVWGEGIGIYWVGLNDIKTEGQWEYIDQTPCNNIGGCKELPFWSPGQPNNYLGNDPMGQHCAVIKYGVHVTSTGHNMFNDLSCDLNQWQGQPIYALCNAPGNKNVTMTTTTAIPALQSPTLLYTTSKPSTEPTRYADSDNTYQVIPCPVSTNGPYQGGCTRQNAERLCREHLQTSLATIVTLNDALQAVQAVTLSDFPDGVFWVGLSDEAVEGQWVQPGATCQGGCDKLAFWKANNPSALTNLHDNCAVLQGNMDNVDSLLMEFSCGRKTFNTALTVDTPIHALCNGVNSEYV